MALKRNEIGPKIIYSVANSVLVFNIIILFTHQISIVIQKYYFPFNLLTNYKQFINIQLKKMVRLTITYLLLFYNNIFMLTKHIKKYSTLFLLVFLKRSFKCKWTYPKNIKKIWLRKFQTNSGLLQRTSKIQRPNNHKFPGKFK